MLKWANTSLRNNFRRFFPVGNIPKDPLPIASCPVCRTEITSYKDETKHWTVKYGYDGNPYGLSKGSVVYYYKALRQPGNVRSGYIGVLNEPGLMCKITCIWPENGVVHEVRNYCVFDIFFLELPGSIPTRATVNQYFVADNLGMGLVTETQVPLISGNWQEREEEIRQAIREAGPTRRSPLAPEIYSLSYFLHVSLHNSLAPENWPQLRHAPPPDTSLNITPALFEALQTANLGTNQARVILAYWKLHEMLADEEEAPKCLRLLLKKKE